MNKEAYDSAYESVLNASQRDRFLATFSSQIPPLRLKKGSNLPHLLDEHASTSTRRGPIAHQNFLKKSLNVSQEALDMKNSFPTAQMSATHKRSGSMLPFSPQLKKEEHSGPRPKRDLVVEIPQTAKESSAALQELLRTSHIYSKMPSQGMLTPQGMMSVPKGGISSYNTISPKYKEGSVKINLKDSQEMTQSQGGLLKGVVFSESRGKAAVYQKRFVGSSKEQSPQPHAESGVTTPKISHHKNADIALRISQKVPQSRETQVLREALSQYLQVKPPSQDFGTQSAKQLSPVASEKKIVNLIGFPSPRAVNSKRNISGQASRIINNSGEREMKSPSNNDSGVLINDQASMMMQMQMQMMGARKLKKAQEEEAKQERPKMVEPQPVLIGAGECEEDYFREFLGVNKQTFDFEKMMVDQRDMNKNKKEASMYISVASPSTRKDGLESQRKMVKGEDQGANTMLRSMFAFYSKESGRQAPTMDSSKNEKGSSTTCNSLKLMKEGSSKREEKQKADEKDEMYLEEVLQGVDSEEGKARRRGEGAATAAVVKK